MTTKTEALKQARELLQMIDSGDDLRDFLTIPECDEMDRVLELIDAALAEPEPIERCQCGFRMPCVKTVPPQFCKALVANVSSKAPA